MGKSMAFHPKTMGIFMVKVQMAQELRWSHRLVGRDPHSKGFRGMVVAVADLKISPAFFGLTSFRDLQSDFWRHLYIYIYSIYICRYYIYYTYIYILWYDVCWLCWLCWLCWFEYWFVLYNHVSGGMVRRSDHQLAAITIPHIAMIYPGVFPLYIYDIDIYIYICNIIYM
jgi:hypothetical protein